MRALVVAFGLLALSGAPVLAEAECNGYDPSAVRQSVKVETPPQTASSQQSTPPAEEQAK